jgi:Flp pilus assembly pilin Flp
MKKLIRHARRFWYDRCGGVFVEYILLLTIVGIGVIVGLATLKDAIISELNDLAAAIKSIT